MSRRHRAAAFSLPELISPKSKIGDSAQFEKNRAELVPTHMRRRWCNTGLRPTLLQSSPSSLSPAAKPADSGAAWMPPCRWQSHRGAVITMRMSPLLVCHCGWFSLRLASMPSGLRAPTECRFYFLFYSRSFLCFGL